MKSMDEQPEITSNDFKYILQDTSSIYLGARYSYEELLLEEMIPFKLKTIIRQYILKEVEDATSLESHFYYMTEGGFAFETYKELKVKVKISFPEEKKSLTGKVSCRYIEKVYTLKEFAQLNLAKKKAMDLIIREIIFSKMGVLAFAV